MEGQMRRELRMRSVTLPISATQRRSKVIGLQTVQPSKPKKLSKPWQETNKPIQILKRIIGRNDHIPRYQVLWDNNEITWIMEQRLVLNHRDMVDEYNRLRPKYDVLSDDDSEIERKKSRCTNQNRLQWLEGKQHRIVHKAKIKNGWYLREKGGTQHVMLKDYYKKRGKPKRLGNIGNRYKRGSDQSKTVVVIDQENKKQTTRKIGVFADIEKTSGSFFNGDIVERILNSVTDPQTLELNFFVAWKERPDGQKPFPSWERHSDMLQYATDLLKVYMANEKDRVLEDVYIVQEME